MKAYQHLNKFRRDASFTTWLTRIAVNEGLMMLRKRRPNFISLDEVTPRKVEDGAPSPERRFAHTQLNHILGKVISELGPGSQVVFTLRYTEQLSLKGIAETLNLSVPAVKLRLRRLRLDLSKNLNKILPAGEFSNTPEGANLTRNFHFDLPANR
jgi:RNA polymerase sigma-70 factor, ECF subfamily